MGRKSGKLSKRVSDSRLDSPISGYSPTSKFSDLDEPSPEQAAWPEIVSNKELQEAAIEAVANKALIKNGGCGIIEPYEVEALRRSTGLTNDALMLRLLPHAKKAALPQLSFFHVGAAALGKSGKMYLGFNIELGGLPPQYAVHAEQAAVFLAADAGEKELVSVASSAPPCGHCRQFMQELYSDEGLRILCPSQQNPEMLHDLLPHAFKPVHLGVQECLLAAAKSNSLHFIAPTPKAAITPNDITLTDASSPARGKPGRRQSTRMLEFTNEPEPTIDHSLANMALEAARASYAPPQCCPPRGAPAGLALRTLDGTSAAGFVVWSVAFNPGLTTAGPLQGALVKLTVAGCRNWEDIREAVLVELDDVAVRFEDHVRTALTNIAPQATLHTIHLVDHKA